MAPRVRKEKRVGLIGGGNMASALVRGLIASGREPGSVIVSEPVRSKRESLRRRFRVSTTTSNTEAVKKAEVLVLAVKPQIIDKVLDALRGALERGHVVVSIAAGIPLARLEAGLGADVRVVRVMPNTPSLVGRGAAVLCGGSKARQVDVREARRLFATVGQAYVIDDERLMDAVTGLSGSGPAYVYRFAEALIDAGRRAGLPADLARDLSYQTIAGAAEMLAKTGATPRELREAVSSPGGTTVAGLAKLDEGRFEAVVNAAVDAAVKRSRELGRG